MLSKKEIRTKIEENINKEFDAKVAKICNADYYKNQYLEYAINTHMSLQCIIRTYAEALKTGCQLYTRNSMDLKHANHLISYLNVYSNDTQLDYTNQLFGNLRLKTQENYPYLIASSHGRLKSLLSLESKLRKKILMSEVLNEMISNIFNLEFDPDEYDMARSILFELRAKNNQQDLIRDAIGYRIIVDSVNSSTEENTLINFIYDFSEYITEFFSEQGHDVIDTKDFIKSPKKTSYQSYHCITNVLQMFVEIQLRTARMHQNAEKGIANHDVYKDTPLYRFLKEFLYEVSEKADKVSINERIGLLKELHLSNRPWVYTPHEEIPKTPDELQDFRDLVFLQSVFS